MTPHPTSHARILALSMCSCVCGLLAAACAPGTINPKPADTGPTSTAAARKALEGAWELLTLDVTAEDGRHASVEAKGQMVLDDFGNLTIEYHVAEGGLKALEGIGVKSPNPVISTTGQAAIDPNQHRVTYVAPDQSERAFDPTLAARRANPFALERVRYYALGDDGVLTLRTRHDNGRDAAVSRWKRRAPPAP